MKFPRRQQPGSTIRFAMLCAAVVTAQFIAGKATRDTLFLIEWTIATVTPAIAAPAVYLQISGLGPMLGSGFWLIATEQFDPRTAKRRIAATLIKRRNKVVKAWLTGTFDGTGRGGSWWGSNVTTDWDPCDILRFSFRAVIGEVR